MGRHIATPYGLTPSSSRRISQFFFAQADIKNESEEQTFQRNEQSRRDAMEWVANEEPSTWRTSEKELTKIHGNTTSYALNGIKTIAQIQVEQDADLVLKTLKL